jgi:hypothetical protein
MALCPPFYSHGPDRVVAGRVVGRLMLWILWVLHLFLIHSKCPPAKKLSDAHVPRCVAYSAQNSRNPMWQSCCDEASWTRRGPETESSFVLAWHARHSDGRIRRLPSIRRPTDVGEKKRRFNPKVTHALAEPTCGESCNHSSKQARDVASMLSFFSFFSNISCAKLDHVLSDKMYLIENLRIVLYDNFAVFIN